MIRGFRDRRTEALFRGDPVPALRGIAKMACRKLDMLNAAQTLADMRVPPGNRLEALRGDRAGQHGVRINDHWRICFVWRDDGAHDVEIVDYH